MFVAVCDQDFGTSTSSCRKITWPLSLPISAWRNSHSTTSKGCTFPAVNRRLNSKPVARCVVRSMRGFEFRTARVSAIVCLRAAVVPAFARQVAEKLIETPAGRDARHPLYSQPGPRFFCVYQQYTIGWDLSQQSGRFDPRKGPLQTEKREKRS